LQIKKAHQPAPKADYLMISEITRIKCDFVPVRFCTAFAQQSINSCAKKECNKLDLTTIPYFFLMMGRCVMIGPGGLLVISSSSVLYKPVRSPSSSFIGGVRKEINKEINKYP
jgi:hypothetical protein